MSPQMLDAHAKPPDNVRSLYKRYQRMRPEELKTDPLILDFSKNIDTFDQQEAAGLKIIGVIGRETLQDAFTNFDPKFSDGSQDTKVFEHADMPGLHIIPSLLPPSIQSSLLNRMLHRDLSNPSHQTNIHLHYNVTYPEPPASSFFSSKVGEASTNSEPTFIPKNPEVHKPLALTSVLAKKLRWVTFGGQYDWTAKVYPEDAKALPPFPSDIGNLISDLFPDTLAEAAILNFYSPGDTLSVHRDVSETTDRGLVSLSFGCDGIFIIGPEPETSEFDPRDGERPIPNPSGCIALRLRSGDAVYMAGKSRFAWHGVPQIIRGTCPGWLEQWPATADSGDDNVHKSDGDVLLPDQMADDFGRWRGWMKNKRINLNVRQMQEESSKQNRYTTA
ncbi:hypothetical protein P152DRAFT_441208 [Eremomyces bilateralis CBS 781.70]|uniref:mRNA N(6)-methyladenine demethylase n=1 Tax=Eremomyces bilateralis CBS 781.70 TaxID=1392243 RepID=A0A6G1FVB1_9PEZI|nr:uncharacterized protein P152DRAFT_441208 [Eremomyces bilateralis CBS 781.70]KAF1809757.1 hypothetical protein P152DRAFT_441208 [Eremomyces bilateralis CBS 781.70]